MATILTTPAAWSYNKAVEASSPSTEAKLNLFFEKQAKFETGWFLLSLMLQGIFCLPVPAVLIYYFHAPVYIVVVTLGLFFANIIAGMASIGVRAIILLLTASVVIHLALLASFAL